MTPAPGVRHLRDVARLAFFLLPLSALVTCFVLFGDRFTAHTPADLARASYGWPITWVTQDLSRYAYVEYPQTVPFNFTRAWDAPIRTTFHWQWFLVDTLIVGLGVTVVFMLGARAIRRRITSRDQDGTGADAVS